MTINAFHPDFMKTYYSDFWGTAISDASRSQTMSNIVSTTHRKKPSHGTMLGISNKTTHISLKPLDFMVFSKAGIKGVAKKRKVRK